MGEAYEKKKKKKKRHVAVVLFLALVATGVVQPCMAAEKSLIPLPVRWHIHVVNGLSKDVLFVHCKSKDDDLGYHHLVGRGTRFTWTFQVNFWGTTLYWCFLHRSNADVTFDSFWVEKTSIWLQYRCTDNTCTWIAKDDGIYIRNAPDNVAELIHKWVPIEAKAH